MSLGVAAEDPLHGTADKMPHELAKAYEPGAIETRWAEYWKNEKIFHAATPPAGHTQNVFSLLLPPPNVTGRLHMGRVATSQVHEYGARPSR